MAIRDKWLVGAAVLVAGSCAAADGPATDPKAPAYQRTLKGVDAKKVAALEQRIAELEASAKRAEALKVAEEVLALRARLQGADHWEVRGAEWVAKDLRRPLTEEQRERLDEAERLVARVAAAARGGKADARPAGGKALTTFREVYGDDHPTTATCLAYLAELNLARGDPAEAESLYRDALRSFQKALGGGHPATARCMNQLASLYRNQGRLADAERLSVDAVQACFTALGPDHPACARLALELAEVYRDRGKLDGAEPLYLSALRITRAAVGDDHDATATCMNNLAGLYRVQGRWAEAEELYIGALRATRGALGQDHVETATCLNNLALLYQAQGKPGLAEGLYNDALRIYRAAHGDDHPTVATARHNLAGLYRDRGELGPAEPLYKDALRARRKAFGDNHPITAQTLNNLGILYHAQGKLGAAEPLFEDALRIYQGALGDGGRDTGTALTNLAALYHAQARFADAEPLLRRAATAYETARLTAARGLGRALVGARHSPYRLQAAALAARSGRSAFATLESDLARGLLDELATRRSPALTADEAAERDRLTSQITRLRSRAETFAARPAPTEAERKEFDALAAERARLEARLSELAAAVSRREVAGLAEIQKALPPDAAWIAWVDMADSGGRAHDRWACVVRPTGEPHWKRLPGTGEKGQWTDTDDKLPGRLRLAVAGDRGTAPAPAGEVARLAERLRAQRIGPVAERLEGVKTLYVVATGPMAGVPVELLAPGRTVSYVPSGTFLARLGDRPRPATAGVLALGDPVFARPGEKPGADRPLPPGGLLVTVVAPDGAAAKANLRPGDVLLRYGGAELTDPGSLTKAVAAHAGKKSVPVVVWRAAAGRPSTRDVDAGRLGVVVAADPAPVALADRRRLDAAVASRGGDWDELPGTRAEVDRLKKLFPGRAVVLADSDASEQRLDELRKSGDLARYRYLHLATHGQGNTVRALESSLILARDKLPGDPVAKAGEPLLDGRLTAREVLDFWRLDAELVTLSACETAVGRNAGGDGLLGFAQAFLAAGSRSVCLSLWRVDDTATALLMDRFYRNLLGEREGLGKPMGKAAALAEAKAWLRGLSSEAVLEHAAALTQGVVRGPGQKALKLEPPGVEPGSKGAGPFAHPRYWAAFVLVGDPH